MRLRSYGWLPSCSYHHTYDHAWQQCMASLHMPCNDIVHTEGTAAIGILPHVHATAVFCFATLIASKPLLTMPRATRRADATQH